MARVLTCYYLPKRSGFCARLFRAMEALLEAGHEVDYLSTAPFPVEHPRCRFHRFAWPGSPRGLLFWIWFHLAAPVMLLAIGFRRRVTHAFAFNPTYALLLQPLRLLRGIPLVLFVRSDAVAAHRLQRYPRWFLALERLLEGLSVRGTTLYAVSGALAEAHVRRHRFLKPMRIGTLPNDVPPSASGPPRLPVGGVLQLAAVGALQPWKNQGLLLRCLAGLPVGRVFLTIYGVGPGEAELRDQARRLGVEAGVRLAGWTEPETIWPATDLLLFPSLHEGSPNAVLEALARRVPVLASDIPAHREVLPRESLLPLADEGAWRERVVGILEDPAGRLAELARSQEAACRALRFDWDARIRDLILAG